jgi:hypothetical protein
MRGLREGKSMEPLVAIMSVATAVTLIILMPVFWRAQERRRVIEAVQQLSQTSTPLTPDLVQTMMGPFGPARPSRQRDLRIGAVMLAIAVGIALVGLAIYFGAFGASENERVAVGAGIAAVGAIPGCIGLAFILLGLGQKQQG